MRTLILTASLCLTALSALAFGQKTSPRPATQPSSRPSIMDLAAVLKQLPKEAKPDKQGWDQFTKPKAHKWLLAQLRGSTVSVAVPLKNVTLDRVPKPDDPDNTELWRRRITFGEVPVRGMPIPILQSVGVGPPPEAGKRFQSPDDVTSYVSEAEAKASSKWKEGQPLFFTGTVADVLLEPDTKADGPAFVVTIIFSDFSVSPQAGAK